MPIPSSEGIKKACRLGFREKQRSLDMDRARALPNRRAEDSMQHTNL